MVLDDVLVFEAEREGLRRLAQLRRPKVQITLEDVAGATCLWQPGDGSHRDEVRLVPGMSAPFASVLVDIRRSRLRTPGGHLYLRGVPASFDAGTVALLERFNARRDKQGPHALMAMNVREFDEAGPAVIVADDAESLAQLRSVVRQVFAGREAESAEREDDEADFYHAPGFMIYLGVIENDQLISTGSILIVDGVANLWSIATLPSARRRGAASAILRAACTVARRRGATAAALRTSEALARDGGVYNRVGFRLVGHEQAWNLDDVDDLDLLR